MSEEVKSASELKKEDWMNSKWRPMMGWMYMVVCTCDFVIFPVLWSLLHAVLHTANMVQWQPLTLQGAGLFHIAMGAVLGIAAFGRTQEKLGGANNGGAQTPGTGFQGGSSTFGQPQSGGFGNSGGFNSPAPSNYSGGFGSTPPTSFAPAPSWGTTPTNNFGGPAVTASGKKIVPQDQDPVL
jgi:hypothetical protein